jgi:hypothetical protein
VKKPKRRIQKNYKLRGELIDKGFIIPDQSVPRWLKNRGFAEAAKSAAARRGLFHV